MTNINKRKPKKAVKNIPGKVQDHYGVFNHMIEDNINFIITQNSLKWRILGWVVYSLIIGFLTYILFTH